MSLICFLTHVYWLSQSSIIAVYKNENKAVFRFSQSCLRIVSDKLKVHPTKTVDAGNFCNVKIFFLRPYHQKISYFSQTFNFFNGVINLFSTFLWLKQTFLFLKRDRLSLTYFIREICYFYEKIFVQTNK